MERVRRGACRRVVLAVVVLVALAGIACSKKDDTTVIRSLVQKGAELAEQHAIGDLMDLTAPGFTAVPGDYDARTVKGVLFAAFRHYGNFKIHFPQPTVNFNQTAGQADTTIYYVIVRQDQQLPGLKELYKDPKKWVEAASEKADLYQLELTLIKSDGGWKVIKAHMEGFKGLGF
jgi:hypothetical protein